eukprot:4081558-Prymnesium_polylepis.1
MLADLPTLVDASTPVTVIALLARQAERRLAPRWTGTETQSKAGGWVAPPTNQPASGGVSRVRLKGTDVMVRNTGDPSRRR